MRDYDGQVAEAMARALNKMTKGECRKACVWPENLTDYKKTSEI